MLEASRFRLSGEEPWPFRTHGIRSLPRRQEWKSAAEHDGCPSASSPAPGSGPKRSCWVLSRSTPSHEYTAIFTANLCARESAHQIARCGENHSGQEVSGSLVISGGDSPEPTDSAEQPLASISASNVSAAVQSAAWPDVRPRAFGCPFPSTTAWTLVLHPPRLRPGCEDSQCAGDPAAWRCA